MTIIIDTREQRPWSFPPDIQCEVGTLRQGDYAIAGDTAFAIERKSADDFAGTMSTGWPRFVREMNRMAAAGFCARVIIVEATLEDFAFRNGREGQVLPPNHEHIRLTPAFLMKRVAELTLRGISVLFADNPELASALALRCFFEREKQIQGEKNQ